MPKIFSWKCSFYKNDLKRWVYGKLNLHDDGISFLEECSSSNIKVKIHFSVINDFKKATSTLIYSCIFIKANSDKFWFSSFTNQDNVFNTIEHFWKEKLLGTKLRSESGKKNEDLLRIVYNTQDTLMGAAKTLHVQGKQLTHTSQTMNKINNDLFVADRIAGDLDSWFGAWRVKGVMKTSGNIQQRIESPLNNDKIEYTILFAKVSQESHQNGYLLLRNDILEIFNLKSEIVFAFVIKQISEINVHSPWDLTIVKHSLGKPDINVHIISTRAPIIIQTLQTVYGYVASYDEPPVNDDEEEIEAPIELSTEHNHTNLLNNQVTAGSSLQKIKQEQVSEQDVEEISTVLKSIKTLALDIGVEQDAQIKQIDHLNQAVDRAATRIQSTDRKVKKMT